MRARAARVAVQVEAMQIRVIVFQEGDMWVAQCLEYDIGAQAKTLDELQRRVGMVLKCEMDESLRAGADAPFGGINAAPRHFHEMWERRIGGFTPMRPFALQDARVDMALCA